MKSANLIDSFSTWSWQQNQMQPCSQGIPVSDRGFRYGQHLFETIAIREGRLLFAKEHLKRFFQAAEKFHFPLETACHQELENFFRNTEFQNGMLRLFVTAGDGSPTAPIVAPRLFAFFEATTFPSQEEIAQGADLLSLAHPIGNHYWGVKNGNYWEHLCALKEAQRADAHEGLIFDADGILISASMANVIVWLEDLTNPTQTILTTPSLARGARDGVVRAWVREQHANCIECDLTRADLQKAKAMAITNSRLGVMPVATLDGKRLPEFSLSLELAREYLITCTTTSGSFFCKDATSD